LLLHGEVREHLDVAVRQWAALRGELASARALHIEGLTVARRVRFTQRVAYGLLHLGRVERLAGDAERSG